MADQCCSYNDGGSCVADCGMNREGNATFQCVCSNFWTGANCDSMFTYMYYIPIVCMWALFTMVCVCVCVCVRVRVRACVCELGSCL